MNNQTSHVESRHSGGYQPMAIDDRDFDRLTAFVHKNYGIDLSQKRKLIAGRLTMPLRQSGYQTFTEFVDHLLKTKDDKEITLLLNKLTTNYTFFMRETDSLDYFRDKILPDLVRKHQSDKTLAIWSAGCSSGEEPYNISMYILDYLGTHAKDWDTRLLATDISAQALHTAIQGTYHLPDNIPESWLSKYFVQTSRDSYTVAPQVRHNVIFRTFNLMDPIHFQRKFDLILCRNVMIYFDQPTKDALVHRFYDATVPGGYLMISCSETLGVNNPYQKLTAATFQKKA
jgi:chemotaxis protein methyltransferase CheR